MNNAVLQGVMILDNVEIELTHTQTGATRSFSSHNIALNHAFSVLSRWMAGANNTGQNAVAGPTVISLGSGSGTPTVTDTGLFTAISGATASLSYAQANSPSSGTTTFVFQIGAGVVTTQVTEAFLADASGNGFAHTLFGSPFTPSASETITITWTYTFAA